MRSLFEAPAITVGELCRRINRVLLSGFPQRVRVVGEISKCQVWPSGHAYFTLKDAEGLVACVCFSSALRALKVRFPLPDGSQVEVAGRVEAYKDKSQYQLVVDDVVPIGRGELYRKYELLKEKLLGEGLFDEARKRPIPPSVHSVAIVTSRGGAVLHDFLTTCRRRGAHLTVTLIHAPVQGEIAAPRLARAIRFAGLQPVDVVVIARGGGSIEDLWAFNTEEVARAISLCGKPVISGVGHETDVTIADLVADRRAATPTAAAELISPDRDALLALVERARQRLGRAATRILDYASRRTDELEHRLRAGDPRKRVMDGKLAVAAAVAQLRAIAGRSIALASGRVNVAAEKLATLGPAATLARGYAIVFDAGGGVITSSEQTKQHEAIDILVRHGRIGAAVTSTERTHGQTDFEEEG